VATTGLLLGQLGIAARAQVITADTLVLAPTTATSGQVRQTGATLLHTWDAVAPPGTSTNTFLGLRAGHGIDLAKNNARQNTGFGTDVMRDVGTGSGNTAVGAWALLALDIGDLNTAVGVSALGWTTSGEYNAAVGASCLGRNTTGSYNASVGGLQGNTTGSYNTAMGEGSLHESSTGSGNTALGSNALLTNATGSGNTAVGFAADVAKPGYVNATAIGAGAVATGSNMVRIGNESVTVIQGQVPFSWVSDRRWKTDVEPLAVGLELVRGLHPVSYRMKGGNGRLDMGFVAQDVEEVLGDGYNAVVRGDDDERLLSMRYTDLIAPLVRALQEVDERQRAEDAALTALRSENAMLSRQLDVLRARLDALSR
jgi:hypothetical protein